MIQSNINQMISQFGTLSGLYAHQPAVAAKRKFKAEQEIEETKKKLELENLEKDVATFEEYKEKTLDVAESELPSKPEVSEGHTAYNLKTMANAPAYDAHNELWSKLATEALTKKEQLAQLNPTYQNIMAAQAAREEAKTASAFAKTRTADTWWEQWDRAQDANRRMADKGAFKIQQKEDFNKAKEQVKTVVREPKAYEKLKLKNELLRRENARKENR